MDSSTTEENTQKSAFWIRASKSVWNATGVPVLAVLTAVIVGGVVIALAGGNPFAAYRGLVEGAFGSTRALSETAVWASPYIFAGLAVALAFKGGLFNIGAEGQLALGAVAAAWMGYALPGYLGIQLPKLIHLPLTVLAGMIQPDRRRYLGCNPRLAQSPHRWPRSYQHHHDELHRFEHGQLSIEWTDERSKSAQRDCPHPRDC